MVDTPNAELQAELQAEERASAIEPLPELETVADGTDLTLTGAIADTDTLDDTLALELDMLTALIWAPPARGRAVVEALIGTRTVRDAGTTTHVLPTSSVLFLHCTHQIIWETVVALHDEGVPVQPQLVLARLTDQGHATRTRGAMIEIASPRHGRPVADSADLPHLAAALIDAWYRRGYTALLTRMQQVTQDRPTAELAGHWTALTTHQQAAETRWLAIRDALARN
ncbi:hypothetical protein RD149_21775 [Gordonia westfalica]|uniref:DnaB-like helicase N terminal domain-containing protein n=1 Tax=Gordonia westfalica TaxID=158898 RepID=A0ABU2GY32_9ACTN|nr:hypothetical protein [Gordonia westfalica]MDS1116377.1 hypothetical protein [Gordonia westfalica]